MCICLWSWYEIQLIFSLQIDVGVLKTTPIYSIMFTLPVCTLTSQVNSKGREGWGANLTKKVIPPFWMPILCLDLCKKSVEGG